MSKEPLVRIIRRTVEIVDDQGKAQQTDLQVGGCLYYMAMFVFTIVAGLVCGSVMFCLILGPAGLVIGVPAGFLGGIVTFIAECRKGK